MRLIDVDSHFLEPPDWLQTIDPELAAEIPPGDPIERIVQGIVGDPLEVAPRSQPGYGPRRNFPVEGLHRC